MIVFCIFTFIYTTLKIDHCRVLYILKINQLLRHSVTMWRLYRGLQVVLYSNHYPEQAPERVLHIFYSVVAIKIMPSILSAQWLLIYTISSQSYYFIQYTVYYSHFTLLSVLYCCAAVYSLLYVLPCTGCWLLCSVSCVLWCIVTVYSALCTVLLPVTSKRHDQHDARDTMMRQKSKNPIWSRPRSSTPSADFRPCFLPLSPPGAISQKRFQLYVAIYSVYILYIIIIYIIIYSIYIIIYSIYYIYSTSITEILKSEIRTEMLVSKVIK